MLFILVCVLFGLMLIGLAGAIVWIGENVVLFSTLWLLLALMSLYSIAKWGESINAF